MKSAGSVSYDWRCDNADVEDVMLLIRRVIPLLWVGGRAIRCMNETKRANHILR